MTHRLAGIFRKYIPESAESERNGPIERPAPQYASVLFDFREPPKIIVWCARTYAPRTRRIGGIE